MTEFDTKLVYIMHLEEHQKQYTPCLPETSDTPDSLAYYEK